jgi:hypothetical protein
MCRHILQARAEAPRSGRVRPQPKGRAGSFHALLIVATSSGRLFLNGLLASIARLRFTGTPILNPFPDRAQRIYSERSTVS